VNPDYLVVNNLCVVTITTELTLLLSIYVATFVFVFLLILDQYEHVN